ncbi:tumor necrosis factor receptor superfamily member 5 isoform 1-T1 [Synchiropus picturatus]
MFRKLSESSGILKAEEELPTMRCSEEDQYLNQNGRCCEKCPAGTHVAKECTNRETTQCQECGNGRFTTTKNSMSKCLVCRQCYPSNRLRVLEECQPKTNRVCQCESRFYCVSPDCDICRPVTSCPPGQGVKVQPTRTNDTVCAPCGQGTYSNTSDLSACRPHTRCEDVGRHLATAGTSREDAMCGDLKTLCPWTVPASLWAGFLLTLLLVLLLFFFYWRRKRRDTSANVPVQLEDTAQVEPFFSLERNGHCQESCAVPHGEPVLTSDDVTGSLSPKLHGSFTQLEISEPSDGHVTGRPLLPRTTSEPIEDEWSGS